MRRNSFSNNNSSSLDVLPSKDYTKYAQAKLTKTNQSLLKSNGQVLFPEVKKNKGQSTIVVKTPIP